MSDQIKGILDSVLHEVQDHGAQGDVIVSSERQLGLKANAGELSEYKVTSSLTVGVRVVVGDQIGTSYSESTQPSDLKKMGSL